MFSLLVLLLAGCNRSDQEIKVYRVVKAPVDATTAGDAAVPITGTLPALQPAAVPPNWEAQPLSQMRQASFLVHGENGAVADVSFVTLGPSAGNILDNVNRWLSQLGQPPITAEKLANTVQQLPTARGNIAIVDLTGEPENGDAKKDGRIIAAIASDAAGTAFYKMRGNRALAGTEKENFLKWVSASRATKCLAARLRKPRRCRPIPLRRKSNGMSLKAGQSGAPSPMRYASFTAEANGAKADISVVTFPGDGGNDIDNVNRWRQQIGLPPIEASALKSMISPIASNDDQFFHSRHDGRELREPSRGGLGAMAGHGFSSSPARRMRSSGKNRSS